MPSFGPWLPTDPEDRAGGFSPGVVRQNYDLAYGAALEGPEESSFSDFDASYFLFQATGPSGPVFPADRFVTDQRTAFGGTVPFTADNPTLDPSTWPAGATGYEFQDPAGVIASLRFYATIQAYLDTSGPIAATVVVIPDSTGWVTPEIAAAGVALWSGTPPTSTTDSVDIDVDLMPAVTAGFRTLAVYTDGYPPVIGAGEHIEVRAQSFGWYGTFTYSDHRFIFGGSQVRQRQIPGQVRQRQIASEVRQRQCWT